MVRVVVVNNLGKIDPVSQQPDPEERGRPGCSWGTICCSTTCPVPCEGERPAHTEHVSVPEDGLQHNLVLAEGTELHYLIRVTAL